MIETQRERERNSPIHRLLRLRAIVDRWNEIWSMFADLERWSTWQTMKLLILDHCCHAKDEDSWVDPNILVQPGWIHRSIHVGRSYDEDQRMCEWLFHHHHHSTENAPIKTMSILRRVSSNRDCSYFGISTSMLSMTSEDDDLIEIVIIFVIVSKKSNAKLER